MTDLILLRWFDSTVASASAVFDAEDIASEKLVVLETVGWLVAETDAPYGGHYVLAASKHGAEDWRGVQLIPKVNVIAVGHPRELGEEKP